METPEAAETHCVCRHSIEAHNIRNWTGCSFCNCTQFQRPTFAMVDEPVALSKFSSSALDVLQQGSGLNGLDTNAMVAFVKDGKGRMFAPQSRIVGRGDKSHALHVVLSGSVLVEKELSSQGRELGPGGVAGDLRAFTGDPRWASITALQSAATLEVDTTNLSGAVAKYPGLLQGLVRSLMPFSEHPEEIMKSPLWAARRQPAAQAAAVAGEDPDAAKRAAIAARWAMLKAQQRAAEEATRRAQQVARDAIKSQTSR